MNSLNLKINFHFAEFRFHGIHQMTMEAGILLATLLKLAMLEQIAGVKCLAIVQNVHSLLKV